MLDIPEEMWDAAVKGQPKMKKFVVDIVETLILDVEVEAETWQEAQQKVQDMYYNDEIRSLGSEDHVETEFLIEDYNGEEI